MLRSFQSQTKELDASEKKQREVAREK